MAGPAERRHLRGKGRAVGAVKIPRLTDERQTSSGRRGARVVNGPGVFNRQLLPMQREFSLC